MQRIVIEISEESYKNIKEQVHKRGVWADGEEWEDNEEPICPLWEETEYC